MIVLVEKLLPTKQWVHLNNYTKRKLENISADLNSGTTQLLQRKLVESSLTLVQNKLNLVPLKRLDTLRVAVLLVGTEKTNQFKETLSSYLDMDCFFLKKDADSLYMDSLLHKLSSYNLIIAGIHNTDYRP